MSDLNNGSDPDRQAIVNEMHGATSDAISGLWWTFMIKGVLAIILALFALFMPAGSIATLLRLAGIVLLIDGALTFFARRSRRMPGVDSSSGILSAVIGLILLIFPTGSARLVFVLLGIWAAAMGISYLINWWTLPQDPERDTLRNVGLIELVVGIVLIFWPGTGVVAMSWAIAIIAFIVGALSIAMATRLRRLNSLMKV